MSEEHKEAADSRSKGGVIPWIVVGLLSAGAGSAVPLLLPVQGEIPVEQPVAKKVVPELPAEEETVFVPFDEPGKPVVVNLNEGRMTRFLRVAITLQIPRSQQEHFGKLLESRKAQLRNWLLSEISDKDLDEIRGA